MSRNEIEIKNEDLVKNSVKTIQEMMLNCPNPTQEELRKLLAIQGTILNQIGIEILIENRRENRNGSKMQLGLKFLTASREALKSSANIIDKSDGKSDVEDNE
jgi:hypothetical protein